MTSPALTLRPATDDDLPFLLALRKATMTEHLRRAGAPDDDEHHLARIRHRFGDAWIVWAAGQPAGLFKTSRDADAWRVVQIQIAPAFQGQGLGRRLLADLLEQADAQGAAVTLSVLRGNPARRLYESLGFTPVEEKGPETEMRYEPGAARPAADPLQILSARRE
ncbi:MAG: N-acetyltransferase family protein [Achromobacter veterisilvae]